MSTFNIENFKSQINVSGLSKSNRFEIQIVPPATLSSKLNNAKLVSLFCEISSLPGMSITTKGQRIYGPAYQRPISSEFGGDSISMTFYVDNKFDVKEFFDSWMFSIVNPNSFNVMYQQEYVTPIKITQLNENDEDQYSIFLEDAFPRSMNMMNLDMSSTNQIHKLTVNFSYRRWFSAQSGTMSSSFSSPKFPPNLQEPYRTLSASNDTINT
jgi:hypothetical protein